MANIYLKADKHEAIIKLGRNVNEFVDTAVSLLLEHPEIEKNVSNVFTTPTPNMQCLFKAAFPTEVED